MIKNREGEKEMEYDFDKRDPGYEEFLKMSMAAYPYLKGFLDPPEIRDLWCNGWNVYIKTDNCQNLLYRVDPPWRDIKPFRVLRIDEIQSILIKMDFTYVFILDKFHDYFKDTIGVKPPGDQITVINRLWLESLMYGVFDMRWDAIKNKWGKKDDG